MTTCPDPRQRGGQEHTSREQERMAAMVLDYFRKAERRNTRLRAALLGTLYLLLLAAVVTMGNGQRRPQGPGATEHPALSGDAFAEGLDASVPAVGVPLPSRPLPHWKKPPCSKRQRAVNDACWLRLNDEPDDDHCGENYEFEGHCWAPVAEPQRAPSSIHR